MNIYNIYRNDGCDYDEYDSFIVLADSDSDAVQMILNSNTYGSFNSKNIEVNLIDEKEPKILLGSFNAG